MNWLGCENEEQLRKILNEYAEDYLTSPSNNYVAFNSHAENCFQGTLLECIAYMLRFNDLYSGNSHVIIYSKEAYDKLLEILNKN